MGHKGATPESVDRCEKSEKVEKSENVEKKYLEKVENALRKIEKTLQHARFQGGPPPQYYPRLMQLDFGVRMGPGIFFIVWPQADSKSFRTIHIPQGKRAEPL